MTAGINRVISGPARGAHEDPAVREKARRLGESDGRNGYGANPADFEEPARSNYQGAYEAARAKRRAA